MFSGSRFRSAPETSSLRSTVGAALVGLALLGGSWRHRRPGGQSQASPMASPVAVAAWIDDIAIDLGVEPDGDSTTVGVIVGDVLEIDVAEFETRPFVGLQTANNTDGPIAAVLLMVPDEFDPATLILPGEEAGLPEGVTPLSAATWSPPEPRSLPSSGTWRRVPTCWPPPMARPSASWSPRLRSRCRISSPPPRHNMQHDDGARLAGGIRSHVSRWSICRAISWRTHNG